MYQQFFLLFAMIFTGYFLRKINLITTGMIGGINKFTLYFTFPCILIFNIGTLKITASLMRMIVVMFFISLAMYIFYAVYSRMYTKLRGFPERVRNVAELSMVSPNNGFMGFPISMIFFGQVGMTLMAVNNAAFNIFIFTYGKARMKNREGMEKATLKENLKICIEIIKNPIVIGIIIGFVISGFSISLKNPFGEYLSLMGSMATPLAMTMIGGTLAGSKFLDMFKNHIVWESAINKVLILWILTYGILYFLPIDSLIKSILVLAIAMPTAATITMMAEEENQNAHLASKILFFGTVLSMATIPLALAII